MAFEPGGSPSALASMLDQVGQAVIGTDTKFRVVYWNNASESMFGWTGSEALGRQLLDVTGGEVDSAREQRLLERLASETSFVEDFFMRRRDGSRFPVRATMTPLRDGDEFEGVVAVLADLTEHHEAIEAMRWLSAIVESSSDAIIGMDLDGRITSWNSSAERLYGYLRDEVMGKRTNMLVAGTDISAWADFPERISRGERIEAHDFSARRKDGSLVEVSVTISPVRTEDGRIIGAASIARDVTERLRLERAAEDTRRRLEEAQRVAKLGSFELDLATGLETWSEQYFKILGLEHDAVPSVALFASRLHPDDKEEFRATLETYVDGELEEFGGTWRVVRSDGGVRWLQIRARSLVDANGETVKVVGTALDVTEQHESEEARWAAEEQFRLGFERGALGMIMTDLGGIITRVNPAVCAMLGRGADEIVGVSPDAFSHPDDNLEPHNTIGNRMLDQSVNTSALERRYVRPNGEVVWALVDIALVRAEDGTPRYFFAQVQDVTERKRSEAAFEHLALHDPLTGLPNRLLLQDRLAAAIARAQRHNRLIAVVFADIDHFKLVNDTLGHSAGDQLLVELAERLAGSIRAPDTVGRFGGDEFVMICEDVADGPRAFEVGRRVMRMLEDPFLIAGQDLFVTVSCGVVLAGAKDTPMTVLRDADAAMYRAKELGRARVELFDQELRQRAERRLGIEKALRQALDHDELTLVFQPIVDLDTGVPIGVESLLRLPGTGEEYIPPSEFIPIAEQSGLVSQVGRWVIDESIRQITQWRAELEGAEDLWVSVNLSARQLAPELVEVCTEILERHGARGQSFGIEITESVVMDDVETSIEVLRRLRQLGVMAAVDDFGTGYSSLEYLKRLPLRALKIDRSFVDGLGVDPHDSSIVRAIVSLGRALDLEPCAEGVETESQVQELLALGCRYAQGFWWSEPLAPEAFEEWYKAARGASASLGH